MGTRREPRCAVRSQRQLDHCCEFGSIRERYCNLEAMFEPNPSKYLAKTHSSTFQQIFFYLEEEKERILGN